LVSSRAGYRAADDRRDPDAVSAVALRAAENLALERLGSSHGATSRVAGVISAVTRGGAGWHVTTVALLATAPRSAKVAAAAGSAGWAATSLLVAGLKRVAHRRRPVLAAVGPPTRTSSMPSSHTATAFAYGTAAALQHRAAAPLLIPAAAVAWSRVRSRRHFPTDVIAGAAVGIAVGALTGLLVRRVTRPAPSP
jgi:undecaprenyl-diphosphatase